MRGIRRPRVNSPHKGQWRGALIFSLIWSAPEKTVKYKMTLSNGNIFRVTGPLCGEFSGHRWIPFTLFCVLNKRLSKQSSGWWFGTPSRSLRRHCNVNNRDAGDLRRHRAHYDVTVMFSVISLNGIHCNSGHRCITIQLSVCYDLLAVSNIRGIHQARDPDIIWLLHVAAVPGIGCNLSPWDHRNLYCNCDSKK